MKSQIVKNTLRIAFVVFSYVMLEVHPDSFAASNNFS